MGSNSILSKKIQHLFRKYEFNYNKIAKLSGIPLSIIERIERDAYTPKEIELEKLAKAFQINIGYLKNTEILKFIEKEKEEKND